MTLARDVTATLQPGFRGTHVPTWLVDAHAAGLVSVCLYGDNVTVDAPLQDLCSELHRRMPGILLATDEEGGDVTRLHYPAGSPVVGNAVLGRLDDPTLTRSVAASVGAELAAHGIGLDLAPVADVNSAPENPVIGVRSFGADPALVARHTAAAVEGLATQGIAACLKHFPGHGDTTVDSHLGLPRVEIPLPTLLERELEPFRAGIAAGAEAVMTSHIVVNALDPEVPATFSPAVLRVLRERLGFTGVVVSDALDMAGASAVTGVPEAAVRALAAGVDLLCLGSATTPERFAAVRSAVVTAVETGRLPAERVREAADRVRALAARHGRPPADTPGAAPSLDVPDATRVASAFTLSSAARAFLEDPSPVAVVQVGSGSNLAVGGVGWGPEAVGGTVAESEVPADAKVAVVARGVDADHPAVALAERLRSASRRVVVVEAGWPRTDLADIVVWGGSPAVATALLDLLHERVVR